MEDDPNQYTFEGSTKGDEAAKRQTEIDELTKFIGEHAIPFTPEVSEAQQKFMEERGGGEAKQGSNVQETPKIETEADKAAKRRRSKPEPRYDVDDIDPPYFEPPEDPTPKSDKTKRLIATTNAQLENKIISDKSKETGKDPLLIQKAREEKRNRENPHSS